MNIIVLGGLGSMTGTLAGAFTWALLLEGVLRLVLPQGFETWRYVAYPLLLLLTMLLRPKGILGDYEMPFLRQILPPLRQKKTPGQETPPSTAGLQEVSQ
jgi:branched-chain amino acid transport system permease protein